MTPPLVKKLRAARRLIERGWTRGALARDASGREVPAMSRAAVRFCVDGACIRASGGCYDLCQARDALEGALPDGVLSAVHFNDDIAKSKRDVIALFDRAIAAELARAKGGVA